MTVTRQVELEFVNWTCKVVDLQGCDVMKDQGKLVALLQFGVHKQLVVALVW